MTTRRPADGRVTSPIDKLTARVIEDHLLAGPRPGQCRCGFGDASLPVEYLARPHSAHLVEQLRIAGVLKVSETVRNGPQEPGEVTDFDLITDALRFYREHYLTSGSSLEAHTDRILRSWGVSTEWNGGLGNG